MIIFVILLFIFIFVCITAFVLYVTGDLPGMGITQEKPKKIIPLTSAFPEYIGMKGPDVLVEMNASHPQYSVEIVAPDYVKYLDLSTHREDRVRLFVSQSGLVQHIAIG